VEGVEALAERGHDLHVVVPEDGPLVPRLERTATVHVCWMNRWMTGPSPPRRSQARWLAYDAVSAGRAIGRIARVVAADVMVTNTIVIAAGAAGAAWARLPHVWFIHEFGLEDHGVRFHLGRRTALALMNRASRRLLVNSQTVHDHFAQWLPASKLRLVRYAIDVPAASAPTPTLTPGPPYRLVLVGVRQPGKGQQDAVAATALLAREGLDVQLELIGPATSPEFESELADLARAGRIEDRVSMAAFDEQPFERVAAAHVALVCSRAEALGRVTVEAMKLGKPVVGAAGGATPELVRDGWNGLLYPPGDAKALADAVRRVIADPAAAETMGKRGRAWALETFTRARYARGLEAAFEEAVG
jgi:glycosyltransferase involved in cell wall biosynthesis